MDNKEKQKDAQKNQVHEKERSSIRWELTEDDKLFLRSCNISSK